MDKRRIPESGPARYPHTGKWLKPGKRRKPGPAATEYRAAVLERLLEADGPSYDELCHEIVTAFRGRGDYAANARGVRAIRELLWRQLAVTEPDESVWLTASGWEAIERMTKPAAKAGAK